MKKRVHIYAGIAAVALGLLLVYFIGFKFTGFTVIQQQNQTDFDQGVYNDLEYNGSAIVLSANQTSGEYTSEIFNALETAKWNNLSFQGVGNLTFEVRSCSSADCSNSSFLFPDLNNLNLSGQYFQYKVAFYDNDPNSTAFLEIVNIDYTPLSYISLSITQPTSGVTVNSQSSISLQFNVAGDDLTCWYSVYNISSEVITNTTLQNCGVTTFDVNNDGTYTVNLYVNNSYGGFTFQSSSFTVDTSSSSSTETPPATEEEPVAEETEESVITGAAVEDLSGKLILSEIQDLTMSPNSSRRFTVEAGNIATKAFTSCKLNGIGALSSWVNPVSGIESLNQGTVKEFDFDLNVPEVNESEYTVLVLLSCREVSKSIQFVVNVVKEKIGFELINAQRTSDDEVTVTYLLKELSNSEQDVTLDFLLVDSDNNKISGVQENKTLLINSTEEFETIILISGFLIVVNESANETESEFELIVSLNSQIYSSSIQEKILLGAAPISGFAIFGGEGLTGNFGVIIIILVALLVVFLVVRKVRIRMSNKYK